MMPLRLAPGGPRRTGLRLVLGALGTLLLLAVLRRVAWDAFQGALAGLRWPFLAATLVATVAAITLRACRLALVLAAPGRLVPVLRSVVLGYVGTALLPLGGGELLKVASLRHLLGLPAGATAAGWFLDRVMDLAGLGLLLAVLGASGAAVQVRSASPWALAGAPALAGTVLGAAWLVRRRLRQPPPPRGPFRDGSPLRRVLGDLAAGLAILRRPALLARLAALQVLITGLDAGCIWVSFRMFTFSAGLSPLVAVKTTAFLTLGAALPLLPAGVGTHQAACFLALGPAGLNAAQSLAYSVVIQTATFLLTLSLGILAALWRPKSAAGRPPE